MVERKSHKTIKLNETTQLNEIVLPAKQTKTLNYLQPVVWIVNCVWVGVGKKKVETQKSKKKGKVDQIEQTT